MPILENGLRRLQVAVTPHVDFNSIRARTGHRKKIAVSDGSCKLHGFQVLALGRETRLAYTCAHLSVLDALSGLYIEQRDDEMVLSTAARRAAMHLALGMVGAVSHQDLGRHHAGPGPCLPQAQSLWIGQTAATLL
jgi:hypothetical protein